jgi:hypothetical protein
MLVSLFLHVWYLFLRLNTQETALYTGHLHADLRWARKQDLEEGSELRKKDHSEGQECSNLDKYKSNRFWQGVDITGLGSCLILSVLVSGVQLSGYAAWAMCDFCEIKQFKTVWVCGYRMEARQTYRLWCGNEGAPILTGVRAVNVGILRNVRKTLQCILWR